MRGIATGALLLGFCVSVQVQAQSVLPESDLPPASYGDGFPDRYSKLEYEPQHIPEGLPVEVPVITYSPFRQGVATVERTLGSEIPYDRSVAVVTIEHKFGDPIYLVSTGFRTITVTWIGERYVRLDKGIGHVVSIEEIFDLVDRKWLVRHTITYRWP